jgi:hypothetical protein
MKFRRLTIEELEHLKDDFVKFLASNTVTAQDWQKTKEANPQKAEELIELFSDIVLEKVYSKVDLLEVQETHSILFFKFDDELITTLGISTEDGTKISELTENQEYDKVKITGFRNTRVLEKSQKATEVHRLIESGALIGRKKLFDTLNEIIE